MLYSIVEVQNRIAEGKPLFLAGSESALSQIPKGNWIGGTIPYFMDVNGGTCSESQIFVNEVPDCALKVQFADYTAETLPSICKDAPENGFSFIIIPAASPAHRAYAEDAPNYEEMYLKPVVGWISGVLLSEIGRTLPKVFNGQTGKSSSEGAVVAHVTLPAGKQAELDIVNIFKQGSGDTITFPSSSFSADDCMVNGSRANFAGYIARTKADSRIPLTADYNGSIVNVSIQSVDAEAGKVNFYAPVFAGIEYKFAAPVSDYVAAFEAGIHADGTPATFSCNCILNYLYGDLEGKHTGGITGPITFGEIAHQLLNQTLVRLSIREVSYS
jgi:hypothetical protein